MPEQSLEVAPLSPEELLGPPKFDFLGFFLMLLVALVSGFVIGLLVFLFSYIFLGKFTIQSGISPILLSMITFFSSLLGNILYVWGMTNIFPHIYRDQRRIIFHVSLYTVLLYIVMALVYILVNALFPDARATMTVYVVHIVMNIFGLLLLSGLLSFYRYSILVFYSTCIGLVLTGLIPMYVFTGLSSSNSTLFIFMVFSSLAFMIMTFVSFGLQAVYYRIYTLSGSDPLGNALMQTLDEEVSREAGAKKQLFQ